MHAALLQPTATTVSLVNSTLRLANEANNRSTVVLHRIVEKQIRLLDADVFKFIKDHYTPDIRSIMDKPDIFEKLRGLIERFNMLEAMNSTLDTEVPLTKNCEFIKGMGYYRNARYDDALECWSMVV